MANEILSGINDVVFGGARRRDKRTEETHELKKQRMLQLIENDKSLNAKRDALLKETTDPVDQRVKDAVDLGKIATAREKFGINLTDETAAFFDDAEAKVKARSGFETETFEKEIEPARTKTIGFFEGAFTNKKRGDVVTTKPAVTEKSVRAKPVDRRGDFTTGVDPFADIAQASTPDFPEDTTPKTFDEIGLTEVGDQATLQEMQKAIPDRDLKQEFIQDPKGMERLMKLWKDKKLNKANIGKAFSALQAQARASLGIV